VALNGYIVHLRPTVTLSISAVF